MKRSLKRIDGFSGGLKRGCESDDYKPTVVLTPPFTAIYIYIVLACHGVLTNRGSHCTRMCSINRTRVNLQIAEQVNL